MKLTKTLFIAGLLMALALMSIQCGKGSDRGSDPQALLKFLPGDASGYAVFNFSQMAQLGLFKSMKEKSSTETDENGTDRINQFKHFITQTGFDPEKDLNHGVMAIFGEMDPNSMKFVFLVQGQFVPEKIIEFSKSQYKTIKEQEYNSVTLYQLENKENEEAAICFPKKGLAAIGHMTELKKTVDLIQGKGKSLTKAPMLGKHTQEKKADALFSTVLIFPEKAKTMQKEMNTPFEFDLSKAETLALDLFFKAEVWSGALIINSPNPEGNQKNVNTLTMLKNMAVMLGPEVADVTNGITLTASDKMVEIKFSITNAQLDKLSAKAKEKFSSSSESETDLTHE